MRKSFTIERAGRRRRPGVISMPRTRVLSAGGIACIAASAAVGSPLIAAAGAAHAPHAHLAAAKGTAFGGVTEQGWPVAFQLNGKGNQVRWAAIGLRLPCTSGDFTNQPDGYTKTAIHKNAFRASFGPVTARNDDGTSIEVSGSYHGALNKARTAALGTWRLKLVAKDATGAVIDSCDSGKVKWSARQ
jgi:hypothetical protein